MPKLPIRIIGGESGFSLQEVLVVAALGLIVTAVGLPVMTNAIANMKLRSSMTTVSGLLQDARAVAVQQNKTKTACHFNRTSPPYSLIYFAKDATACTSSIVPASGDPQVELEAPITPYGTPTGTGAPGPLDNNSVGTTSNPLSSDPSFNSRGLPCAYAGGTCTANSAFVQYFKDNRISGSGGWAAISIAPAGRIKRWFWNGSSWVN